MRHGLTSALGTFELESMSVVIIVDMRLARRFVQLALELVAIHQFGGRSAMLKTQAASLASLGWA